MENLTQILENLKKEIPYKWRVQSFSKNRPQATCVAYIDSRDVQDMLDSNCLWSDRYYEENEMLFCEITIYADGREYKRSDTGSESNVDKEKGHSSDAFKRAAVKFGVGRFLYSLQIRYIPANEKKTDSNYPYPVDNAGQRIWDVSKHINGINPQSPPKPQGNVLPWLNRMNGKTIDRNWNRAIATLKEGKSLDYLKTKFQISKENEQLLTIESKK